MMRPNHIGSTLGLGLLLASCAGDPQQTPFEITISRGGGFTGLVRGYHLHDDGRVVAWSRMPGQPDSVLWQTQSHPDSVGRLRAGLERSGTLGRTYRLASNMTTAITYSAGDSSYTWSWGQAGPKKLHDWYDRARQFCDRQKPDEE